MLISDENSIVNFRMTFNLRTVFVSLVAVASTLAAPVIAAESVAVYTSESYPLNYPASAEDDAPVVGYATQLVRAIFLEADIDYSIEIAPWARALQVVGASEGVAVFPLIRSPEREDQFHWIGGLVPADYYLYALKENAGILPTNIEDAVNSRVGVVRDSMFHRYFLQQGFNNLVVTSMIVRNVQMLQRGRSDFIPLNELVVVLRGERYGVDHHDLVRGAKIEALSGILYLALNKDSSADIVARLQSAYASVKASGMYAEILGPLIQEMNDNKNRVND